MASYNPRITKGYDPVTKKIETGLPSVDDATISRYYNNLIGVKFDEELHPIGYEVQRVAKLPSATESDEGKMVTVHVFNGETRFLLSPIPQVLKIDLRVAKSDNTITSVTSFDPTHHTMTPQELYELMGDFYENGYDFKVAYANIVTFDGADLVSCEIVPINYSVGKNSFIINCGSSTIYGDITNDVWTLTDPTSI